MISFKQFLAEAFDSSYPYKQLSPDKYIFNDIEVNIQSSPRQHSNNKIYHIVFNIHSDQSLKRFALTNYRTTTEALKTYSTVIHIVDKHMSKVNLSSGDMIEFMSVDTRTNKIYERYTKHLARKYDMEYAFDHGYAQLVKR